MALHHYRVALHHYRNGRRRLAVAAAAGVFAATLAAFGVPSANASGPPASAAAGRSVAKGSGSEPSPVSLLPASVRKKGTLVAAAEMDFPPEQFYETGTQIPTGYNVDLTVALAKVLHLKAEFKNVNFSGIIAGLDAGRYDVGPSGFYDTKERDQTATMLDFMKLGTKIVVAKGNPDKIENIDDFCGKTIAQGAGESQVQTEEALSSSYCKPAGKPAISVQQFTDATEQYQSIITGRSAATLELFDSASYEVSHHPSQLELVGPYYDPQLYSIALAKGSGQLAKALAAALNVLIKNGTYQKIMEKWQIGQAMIKTAGIDGVPYTKS